MNLYAVGGAIRDELLGLPVQDHDWVVVGATVEDMVTQGFKPVGRDFPVFLHPKTHEEYALARTERKTGPGYKGFTVHASPDVTLEADLARRDLTINAMARDAAGQLIDPFGGLADLQQRRLRHVSPAFGEDPVRILRVARFAARFKRDFHFTVAPETLALMQRMVAAGEVDALVAERVWTELARGLMESLPSEMFRVLDQCHALTRLLPELAPFWGERSRLAMACVDLAARQGAPLEGRFAAWGTALLAEAPVAGRGVLLPLAERLRLPASVRELALLALALRPALDSRGQAAPEPLLALIEQADGLRRPGRLHALLAVHACWEEARTGVPPAEGKDRLLVALEAAAAVPVATFAAQAATPAEIPVRIREARLKAIHAVL